MEVENGDVDDIEAAIRRAEELMSRDLETLKISGSLDSLGADNTETERNSTVQPSNRYRDPAAREELIQRLLMEREKSLQEKSDTDRLAEALHVRQLERQRQKELSEEMESFDANREKLEDRLDIDQDNYLFNRLRSMSPAPDRDRWMNMKSNSNRKERPRSASVGRMAKLLQNDAGHQFASFNSARLPGGHDYSQGDRRGFYRKTKDQIKLQVELERSKDCTFQPKIKSYSKLQQEDPETRLERLSRSKLDYWNKQELKKRIQDEEEVTKSCTFKPDISLAANLPKESNEGEETAWQQRIKEAYRNHVPVERRLFQDANQRWEARDRAKRELEEAELQAQPFRPKINVVSEEIAKQINYEGIESRAARVQREKREKLEKKKLEYEMSNKDLTFKPQISAQSNRLAQVSALKRGVVPSKDVVRRLLSKDNSLQEKQRQREQAWVEQAESEYRFKPKVSENSKRILEMNPQYKENVDFVKRQEQFEEQRKLREQRTRAELHDMGDIATFKPGVNADKILLQSKPERLVETAEERFLRLSKRDSIRKEKLQAAIREHFYSQYNFQPQINPVSEEIVKDTHKVGSEFYDDLYRNERGKHFKRVARSQMEEENLKDCTFKPRIINRPNTQASEVVRASRSVSKDVAVKAIEKQRRKKEQKILQQKREIEYEELQECTFTPTVNNPMSIPKAKGPVVVRGLGRHLELKELKKRQDEERREREAKVFIENTSNIRAEPYTIPQPFNLSGPVKSKYPKYNGELPRDCTFKPRTKVSMQQARVKRILSSSNS